MDNLSLFIIAVSVLLAVLFKWILIRKIQGWMERDLIRQLANGNSDVEHRLERARQEMLASGVKRAQRQQHLMQLARDDEPK